MDIYEFSENFSSNIIKITQEHLDYVNNIINTNTHMYGSKAIKNYKYAYIDIDTLQEINLITFTLWNLDKKGITSANFGTKVKQYDKFVEKALYEYGINLVQLKNYPPFSNPSELYKRIDTLLIEKNLNEEQKKNFFMEFLKRDRIPRQNEILEDIKNKNDKKMFDEMVNDFYELTEIEQENILTYNASYELSEQANEILYKFNLKEFPDYFINWINGNNINSPEVQSIIKDGTEYIKTTTRLEREHNFLVYPDYKYRESEYLNDKLGTNVYSPDVVKIVEFDPEL